MMGGGRSLLRALTSLLFVGNLRKALAANLVPRVGITALGGWDYMDGVGIRGTQSHQQVSWEQPPPKNRKGKFPSLLLEFLKL